MRTPLIAMVATLFLSLSGGVSRGSADVPWPAQFTPEGLLQRPTAYREWIYLTSGLDMSYAKRLEMTGHSMFDNVFVDREGYRGFLQTGTWPDGTMLVLELRAASSHGAILKTGKFQTPEVMQLEVHLKDTKRFEGGWGFFSFSGDGPAAMLPHAAPCYACHQQHAVVDTTFVQFYPTLLPVAKSKGTLAPGIEP